MRALTILYLFGIFVIKLFELTLEFLQLVFVCQDSWEFIAHLVFKVLLLIIPKKLIGIRLLIFLVGCCNQNETFINFLSFKSVDNFFINRVRSPNLNILRISDILEFVCFSVHRRQVFLEFLIFSTNFLSWSRGFQEIL